VFLKVFENLVCDIVAGIFSLNWVNCLEKKEDMFQKLPSGRCERFIFFPPWLNSP
jgi:hypothetical protein